MRGGSSVRGLMTALGQRGAAETWAKSLGSRGERPSLAWEREVMVTGPSALGYHR